MPATKVFITGTTGYIGGSILTTLLKYPNKYEITALVRSKDQVQTLNTLGVQTVIGDFDSLDLLTECAKASDAVVHVNGYNLAAAQALVKGLKAKNDKRAVFLHTSAADVLGFSQASIDVPYDDEDMTRFRAIPDTALHIDVDKWILDNTEDITAAIICPTLVIGIGTGPFRKLSAPVAYMAKAAAARKKAGWVGPRKHVVWGNINIHDLVEVYRLILDGLVTNTIGHGLYFATSENEFELVQAAEFIANMFFKLGLVNTLEVTQFEKEYVDKYLWGDELIDLWVGENRCVASRIKKLGWKPIHPTALETIEQELKYLITTGELEEKKLNAPAPTVLKS